MFGGEVVYYLSETGRHAEFLSAEGCAGRRVTEGYSLMTISACTYGDIGAWPL